MFCRLLLKYVHTLRHIDILNLGVVIAIELLFIVFTSRRDNSSLALLSPISFKVASAQSPMSSNWLCVSEIRTSCKL